MATRKREPNPVYAVALANHERGYGHVRVHIYEALGYNNGTLTIQCQTGGGESVGETYGWKHGLTHYDVLRTEGLRRGYWLMRRIDRQLAKMRTDHGTPDNFAEYALRVLRAAGIRKVHVKPGVNTHFIGDEKSLPCFNPIKQGDALFEQLRSLEQAIIEKS